MRDPFTRLYVHLVWATWDRLPLITPEVQPAVYRCIQAEATRLGCRVGAIGGIEDHVHVLVRHPPAVSISEMVKQTKGVSSRLMQQEVRLGDFFKWQGSYGAFSISERDIAMVRRYIHRQEEHHRSGRLNATLERTMIEGPPARNAA
jgi:putative transposase